MNYRTIIETSYALAKSMEDKGQVASYIPELAIIDPAKFGVGGGIIAVHPNKYTIALWSPKLNAKGNSYRGVKFLEDFTTGTASSIF